MDSAPSTVDLVTLAMGFGGGLALFLYGIRKMSDALKTVAGARLKDVLATFTTNRITGAISGALITAVIQSSSVTTVMVVSFVSAGLLTFTQSVGVIMGANVGTTVTAQIIAFNVTQYSLVMIAGGFLVELLARSQRVRHYGIALMGLGLLFFGMELMSSAASPLKSYPPFIAVIQELRSPILGILAGLVFTAIVQSSSATTGVVILLAAEGFIALDTGIALILGANVGTCITALLSAIGRPRDAVKAAVIHVVFNLVGVLLWVWFIPQFAELVRYVSPTADTLAGAERLAAEVPRQIANAHTIFNVCNTVLLIGFAGALAALVERLVPKPKPKIGDDGRAIYLEAMYLDQPAVALDRVKLELDRMAALVKVMVNRALPAALAGGDTELNALREQDDAVDHLHGAIITYLGQLSLGDLVEPLPHRIQEYVGIANYLENVGDTVESGFVSLGYRRMELGVHFSSETVEALENLAARAISAFEDAVTAFIDRDVDAAEAILRSKDEFNNMAEDARNRNVFKMARQGEEGLEEYRLTNEHVDGLKRIHTLGRRIARTFLHAQPSEADIAAEA